MEQNAQTNVPEAVRPAAADNGMLEQIDRKLEELRKYEKKNYRVNRIRMLCSILILLLCITAGVYLYRNGKDIMQKADKIAGTVSTVGSHFDKVAGDFEDVAEDLKKVEFEKLGKSLQEIADISQDTVETANKAVGGLDNIVGTTETVLNNLNGLKIDALNDGIRELNEVLEDVKKFFDKLPF